MVARERFELSSAAPEAAMFDHCTTGLQERDTRNQNKYFGAVEKMPLPIWLSILLLVLCSCTLARLGTSLHSTRAWTLQPPCSARNASCRRPEWGNRKRCGSCSFHRISRLSVCPSLTLISVKHFALVSRTPLEVISEPLMK